LPIVANDGGKRVRRGVPRGVHQRHKADWWLNWTANATENRRTRQNVTGTCGGGRSQAS